MGQNKGVVLWRLRRFFGELFTQRPGDMLLDGGIGIALFFSKRIDVFSAILIVPNTNRDIAQPTIISEPTNGASFGFFEKFRFRPIKKLQKGRRIEFMAREKILDHMTGGKAIPWADNLAIITPKNAVAHRFAKLYGNWATRFDGEIGHAFTRIELKGFDNGSGRPGFTATGTAAAVIDNRLATDIDRAINIDFTQEEIRARFRVNNHCVFAEKP